MANLLRERRSGGTSEPSDPLDPATLAALIDRLAVARVWCARARAEAESRAQPRSQPAGDATGTSSGHLRSGDWRPELEDEMTLPSLQAALATIHLGRLTALGERAGEAHAATRAKTHAERHPGRLLVCEVDGSLATGESEAASHGYFDLEDRPPWDTWLVAYGRTNRVRADEHAICLLTWVPERFDEVAACGVEANRNGCVYWLGDRADGLATQLRAAGWTEGGTQFISG